MAKNDKPALRQNENCRLKKKLANNKFMIFLIDLFQKSIFIQ